MKLPWYYIVIAALLLIIVLQRACSPGHDCPEVTEHTDTIVVPGDSIPYLVERTDTVKEDTIIYRNRPVPNDPDIDTPAIVRDWYATRFYSDTFQKDSSFKAIVEDSIRNNRIVHREFYHQNKRQKKIITNTTVIHNKRKNELYAGAIAGGNGEQFAFGPSVTYRTKTGSQFSYSYDLINKQHLVGAQVKLSIFDNLLNKQSETKERISIDTSQKVK